MSTKEPKRVALTIKPTGISCHDLLSDEEIFDISICK